MFFSSLFLHVLYLYCAVLISWLSALLHDANDLRWPILQTICLALLLNCDVHNLMWSRPSLPVALRLYDAVNTSVFPHQGIINSEYMNDSGIYL